MLKSYDPSPLENWLKLAFPGLIWFQQKNLSTFITNLHIEARLYREKPKLFFDRDLIQKNIMSEIISIKDIDKQSATHLIDDEAIESAKRLRTQSAINSSELIIFFFFFFFFFVFSFFLYLYIYTFLFLFYLFVQFIYFFNLVLSFFIFFKIFF